MSEVKGSLDYGRLRKALREELFGAIVKIYYVPDGCDFAVACCSFNGKIYTHYNNTRTGLRRLYEFDPETGTFTSVRDLPGFWDRGWVTYAPPLAGKVMMWWDDKKAHDGTRWFDADIPTPVEHDPVNRIFYGFEGTKVYYVAENDVLDRSKWVLDYDMATIMASLWWVGRVVRVGNNIFALPGERCQTPAEIAMRVGAGSWTVKKYKDVMRPMYPLYRFLGGFPVGGLLPNTYTMRIGGVEENLIFVDSYGCIYFMDSGGRVRRAIELVRGYPNVPISIQRHPGYVPYWRTYGGQGVIVGNKYVFMACDHSDMLHSGELWSFDGIQFYRHLTLPIAHRGVAYCKGRLFINAFEHGALESAAWAPYSVQQRGFLLEVSPEVFSHRELPSRVLRVWNGYSIGTAGLYSDAEYFDGTYYYAGAELLTAGYTKKQIALISDQAGTLDVEVDYDLRGDWKPFDTVSVTANKLTECVTEDLFARWRFKFTPTATAKVYAWANMEGSNL